MLQTLRSPRPLLFALCSALLASAVQADDVPDARKGPYKDLIEGEFVHQETPLAENGLPFWLFADRKLTTRGKRHPLIVILHGRRNSAKPGDTFKVQSIAQDWATKDAQRDNACFVIQPYYPPQGGWEKVPEKLDATLEHAFQHLPVDPERVYLFGFSNGGQGTFQSLARRPDWFAAAVTVSGPVSPKSVVGKIKAPVWMWVGENDNDLNKRQRIEELAKALDDSGVDIKLDIVPGAGHNCFGKATRNEDVHDWLFDQRLEK
ncbi:MAG: dienelactone hydrolase family protein [Verrucomicrobiota bacterium]